MNKHSLKQHFQFSDIFSHNEKKITSVSPITVEGLAGSSLSLWASRYIRQVKFPLLFVVSDLEELLRLKYELQILLPEERIGCISHDGISPYDKSLLEKKLQGYNFDTLFRLHRSQLRIIIVSASSLLFRYAPLSFYSEYFIHFCTGKIYTRQQLIEKISHAGYTRVQRVEEQGEFAIRGDIIDIFSLNEETPIRMDFFDECLEQIHYFDIDTQDRLKILTEFFLCPARNIILNKENKDRALQSIKTEKTTIQQDIYHDLYNKITSEGFFLGIDNYLPLFTTTTVHLLQQFSQKPHIILHDEEKILGTLRAFIEEIYNGYQASLEQGEYTIKKEQLFFDEVSFSSMLKKHQVIQISQYHGHHNSLHFPFHSIKFFREQALMEKNYTNKTTLILKALSQHAIQGTIITIFVDTESVAEQFMKTLKFYTQEVVIYNDVVSYFKHNFFTKNDSCIDIVIGFAGEGFYMNDESDHIHRIIINEKEIWDGKIIRKYRYTKSQKLFSTRLEDLKEGDFIVHVEYGIGLCLGLHKIPVQDEVQEFLVLEYKDNEKLYVPLDSINKVEKYVASHNATPALHRLGEKKWQRVRQSAEKKAKEFAENLLQIYAKRSLQKSIPFFNSDFTHQFGAQFPYQETPDQEKAIQEVLQDLQNEKPMDRLICGDVGFGKTEVAIRAAFQIAHQGYQVCLIAPTTILVKQHYRTFQERLKGWNIIVESLSRHNTASEVKKIREQLTHNKIQILIATHRGFSKDIQFHNLALLIIDEEHRFGVQMKEKIKQQATHIHCLAMAATPIPRTLQMSLSGIRNLSTIMTPPLNRQAIRTRVIKFNEYTIKEAIQREILRKGQVYFLHNDIKTIFSIAEYISKLFPSSVLAIAHGQMVKNEIEDIMLNFMQKKIHILLCTTIIEAGVDIPNANTIIVNNAQNFGLAQLYQIRGRVGRSDKNAYAYFLIPKDKSISLVAHKRLQTLQETSQLGAGFKISLRDLELRGAGALLGEQQSGHINTVGYHLYQKFLQQAVIEIQSEEKNTLSETSITIETQFQKLIPETYIENFAERLAIYQNVADCNEEEKLWEIRKNTENRFGKLPLECKEFFDTALIKIYAEKLSLQKVTVEKNILRLKFADTFVPSTLAVNKLIQENSLVLLPHNQLQWNFTARNGQDILTELEKFYHSHNYIYDTKEPLLKNETENSSS